MHQDKVLMNVLDQTLASSYDAVPYRDRSYPQSHPDRLATIGILLGMSPKPVNNCRVLEIGCAAGNNLLPLACSLPDSTFVGIDLSLQQVLVGQAAIKQLGLGNVEINHLSIMDFDSEFEFDYIISHGVYSWIPGEAQEKMMSICQRHLSANGIAYISYNTYPGWHFRGMIREMMLYHAASFEDDREKIHQSRYLLEFLSDSIPPEKNPYGQILKNELETLSKHADSYLFHEHLALINEPLYFHQFAERAEKQGLRYLGEADVSTMFLSGLQRKTHFSLRRMSNDPVRTEQYMDFVRNRQFRQTLLCKKDVRLNLDPDFAAVMNLFVALPASNASPNGQVQSTGDSNELSDAPREPLLDAAFTQLRITRPQALPFQELLAIARSQVSAAQNDASLAADAKKLATELLNGWKLNQIVLQTCSFPFYTTVSESPSTSAIARCQARTSPMVSDQLHRMVTLDDFAQQLVLLLDGSLNKEQIADRLFLLTKEGTLSTKEIDRDIPDSKLRERVAVRLVEALELLAQNALLIA